MRTERELREGRDLPVTEGPWRWWHGGAGSAVVGAEAAGSGAGGQEGLGEKKPGPRAQYPMEMGLRVTGSGGDGAEGTWIQQRTTSTVPGWEEEAGTACTTMVAGGGEEAVACFGLVGGEARRRWGSGLVAQGETRKLEGDSIHSPFANTQRFYAKLSNTLPQLRISDSCRLTRQSVKWNDKSVKSTRYYVIDRYTFVNTLRKSLGLPIENGARHCCPAAFRPPHITGLARSNTHLRYRR